MAVCELCGEESFHDEDGLFFCNGCGTQSQELQVVVEQAVTFDDLTNVSSKKRKLQEKRSAQPRERKLEDDHDPGKVWHSLEAFQMIIKAQVDSLIQMGFPAELKAVVRELWFSYLRVGGHAFQNSESSDLPFVRYELLGDIREASSLGDVPDFARRRKKLSDSENESMTAGIDDHPSEHDDFDDVDGDEMRRRLSVGQELTVESEASDIGDLFSQSDSTDIEKNTKKNGYSKWQITLLDTLLFCYLGLLWLQEPVLLCDLIQWAEDGVLPFRNIDPVLPSVMKFTKRDHYIFSEPRDIDAEQAFYKLCILTSRLRSCDVEFDLRTESCDWHVLIGRLVDDMKFDNCIARLACLLLDATGLTLHALMTDFSGTHTRSTYSSSGVGKDMVRVELALMAAVVVAVKLVYVLDGEAELNNKVRSSLVRQLNGARVESWTSWVSGQMRQSQRDSEHNRPQHQDDLTNPNTDHSLYLNWLENKLQGSFKFRPVTDIIDGDRQHYYENDADRIRDHINNASCMIDDGCFESTIKTDLQHRNCISEQEGNVNIVKSEPQDDSYHYSDLNNTSPLPDRNDMLYVACGVPIKTDSSCIQTSSDDIILEECGEPAYVIYHSTFPVRSHTTLFGLDDLKVLTFPLVHETPEWHASYRYLMSLAGQRVRTHVYRLQYCVERIERTAFQREIQNFSVADATRDELYKID